ncbi:MAG: hypothetical protein HRU20_26790 [Pseudomonadales bacterium]|nr:hypothetical protein [Pseudomonadales bacterium]
MFYRRFEINLERQNQSISARVACATVFLALLHILPVSAESHTATLRIKLVIMPVAQLRYLAPEKPLTISSSLQSWSGLRLCLPQHSTGFIVTASSSWMEFEASTAASSRPVEGCYYPLSDIDEAQLQALPVQTSRQLTLTVSPQ